MIGWGLNLVYCGLLLLFSPVILFRAIWQGKYRQGWAEKFLGRGEVRTSTGPAIWLHAVSVGEVLILRTLLPPLRERLPGSEIWISTTTHTGHAVAVEKYPDCHVFYFPLDFSWAVRKALQRVRPSLIVLVELELWPNFIREAAAQSIPLVLINGRMSEKSFRGYRRIRWLMAGLWRGFAPIAVQTEEYRRRFLELGAPSDRLTVTGSTKYDGLETDRGNVRTWEIRAGFGILDDETIFIAGSTQSPEESYAIDTYLALRERHPALRLILVPRHQERFDEVANLVESRGLPLLRRSVLKAGRWGSPHREGEAPAEPRLGNHASSPAPAQQELRPPDSRPPGPRPILLLDTLGELGAAWGLADIAFVGGSLTPRGGQNMIEPAAYAAAVLFGPNTGNFRQVVELLLSEQAARVVRSPEELTQVVGEFLEDPSLARQLGETAQRLVLPQQGATARTVDLIVDALATQQSRG